MDVSSGASLAVGFDFKLFEVLGGPSVKFSKSQLSHKRLMQEKKGRERPMSVPPTRMTQNTYRTGAFDV